MLFRILDVENVHNEKWNSISTLIRCGYIKWFAEKRDNWINPLVYMAMVTRVTRVRSRKEALQQYNLLMQRFNLFD